MKKGWGHAVVTAIMVAIPLLSVPLVFYLFKDGRVVEWLDTADNTRALDVKVSKGPMLGDESAVITIVEFSDFECDYCAQSQEVLKRILNDYAGKVRLNYRDFPNKVHRNAIPSAIAARCAGDQGQYWQYHDVLWENALKDRSEALVKDRLLRYASELGLDDQKFRACLDSDSHMPAINEDVQAGFEYKVPGTPTFFINGYRVRGAQPYETFATIIDDILAGRK